MVVLLEVRRGTVVESRHRGSLVFLRPDGSVEIAAGEPEATAFPRSCLKPVQATALVEVGFAGAAESIALAAASHDGRPEHVNGVRAILAGAGLDESALQCPAALPGGTSAMVEWLRGGGNPAPVCHNCSGKHAAMLATCVANGWNPASYRNPEHPLQVVVRGAVERCCGESVRATSVDGCGAPAFAVSLTGLARAFSGLATAPAGSAAATVRDAMQAQPVLVGGSGRPVTAFLSGVPGLVCKDGAECVWGAALPDGRAFAAKVEDGSARALGPLLAAALRHWGIATPVVAEQASVSVLGGGVPVGSIAWSAELRELLSIE